MNDVEAEDFTPDPINLLESNRSLGYSIEEAIADLIDKGAEISGTIVKQMIILSESGNDFSIDNDFSDGSF